MRIPLLMATGFLVVTLLLAGCPGSEMNPGPSGTVVRCPMTRAVDKQNCQYQCISKSNAKGEREFSEMTTCPAVGVEK